MSRADVCFGFALFLLGESFLLSLSLSLSFVLSLFLCAFQSDKRMALCAFLFWHALFAMMPSGHEHTSHLNEVAYRMSHSTLALVTVHRDVFAAYSFFELIFLALALAYPLSSVCVLGRLRMCLANATGR